MDSAGEDIVDELLQLQLEKIQNAHLHRLQSVKRTVHHFHLKKLLHIKYLLEKLLKVIISNNESDVKSKLGKLTMYTNKSKLLKKLHMEMEEHIRSINDAIKLNAHADIHHKSVMDDYDEHAAIACIDHLKHVYRHGISTVFNYLEVVVTKIILLECESRKESLLKFINCLQAPGSGSPMKSNVKPTVNNNNKRSNGSDGETSDHSKSSESDDESESEVDDEVRDEALTAIVTNKESLLGKYQMLVNKLNNVIRVADVDVNCLCNVLIYLNTNIEIDIHASIDKEISE